MKEKLTDITIYSLIVMGVISALEITQATWDLNIIPKDLEKYAYGVTGAFISFIIFLFLASFIFELQGIRKNLKDINVKDTE